MGILRTQRSTSPAARIVMHVKRTQVRPYETPRDRGQSAPDVQRLRVFAFGYSCALWALVFALVFSQGLGAVWKSTSSMQRQHFGQDLALGLYDILGSNDIPFTDRSFVCSQHGLVYKPVALRDALEAPEAAVVDSTGLTVNGYRVVKRSSLTIDPSIRLLYENTCDLIAATIEGILDRCEELGYNVTRDNLRIVDDAESTTTKLLPGAIPVLVMPFSDNSLYARYAVPGWDGSACVFQLTGAYETKGLSDLTLRALNRSVREQKTAEFLGKPGGAWRNGWYEDPAGVKWFSDFSSTQNVSLGITAREFDMLENVERNCINVDVCGQLSRTEQWGAKLSATSYIRSGTALTISTANHYGLFLYDAISKRVITSQDDLDVLVANLSLELLLLRWMVALVVTFRGFRLGVTDLQPIGVGVLSCSRGFHWLPILLLPRAKTVFSVFSTVGCLFEGPQRAYADAWLVMYPGIAEFVIVFFSLLSLLTNVLRRRMSDALFGPTLAFFCLMHWYRLELAESGWFEFDGRIQTQVLSDEFKQISVRDFFTSDIAFRLNGSVSSLFAIKVGVLMANLLPILWSTKMPSIAATQTDIEIALGLHLVCSGGLGSFAKCCTPRAKFVASNERQVGALPIVSSYELVRLGYLVLGDKCLIGIHDWYLLVLLEAVRLRHLAIARMMVFLVVQGSDGSQIVAHKPLLCQSNHLQLSRHCVWDISVRPFR